MRVIHKYGLDTSGYQDVLLPEGAKILAVASQRNIPQLWALIDSDKEYERRRFMVAPTGHPLPVEVERAVYIGTIQLNEGLFVGHVFELMKGGEDK